MRALLWAVMAAAMLGAGMAGAATYTSTQSGNWSTAATWGGAGVPGAADTATVAAGHTVTYDAGATGSVGTLTVNSVGGKLVLGRSLSVTNTATLGSGTATDNTVALDLGGQTLTATQLYVQRGRTIARTGGGTLAVPTKLWVRYNNTALTMASGDTTPNAEVESASLTTTSSGNITTSLTLRFADLYLGANLSLSGGIGIGTTAGQWGYVHTYGYNVTAAGPSKWWGGGLADRGAGSGTVSFSYVHATTPSLDLVNYMAIDLRPGDSVHWLRTGATGGNPNSADLTLTQGSGQLTGLTIGGSLQMANYAATRRTELTLAFDSGMASQLDWGLRWQGNHTNDLRSFYTNGQLIVNAPAIVFDPLVHIFYSSPGAGGDGYTYVGYYPIGGLKAVAGSDGGGVTQSFQIAVLEVAADDYAQYLNAATGLAVTNGQVRRAAGGELLCLTTMAESTAAVAYNAAAPAGSRFSAIAGREKHPMIYVTWFGAAAYCNWRSSSESLQGVYAPDSGWAATLGNSGYRLPTEAEWYKAAAWDPGLGQFRAYGTGSDVLSGSDANFLNSGDAGETNAVRTAPVGNYAAASHYEIRDASGNVWEWCHNLYDAQASNPAADAHALRGGAWGNLAGDLRTDARIDNRPDAARNTVGFRVMRKN